MSEWVVKNPYSGKEVGRYPRTSSEDLAQTLARAEATFLLWRNSSSWTRSQLLSGAAKKLQARHEEFAQLILQEAGKPITYARAEVNRAIGVLEWAAAESQRYAGELLRLDAIASGRPGFGLHTRFPRGPVLGITPFNFPLNLAIHKIAPAIACGCPIVIKPSPCTPGVALKCAELFSEVPGLVQVVLADDQQTAELTRAPEIKTISFTGSAAVGWRIREQAPRKPTTLELGGNAWVLILEDTPRDLFPGIAGKICGGAFGYAGQSCISVQNIGVAQTISEEFTRILTETVRKVPFGDPALEDVVAGPVIHSSASRRIQVTLESLPPQFKKTRSSARQGESENLLPPTLVVADLSKEVPLPPLVQEEIFGPVVTLMPIQDLTQAIKFVNSSRYGLQAGVFSQSLAHLERLYQELEVGGLVANDVPTTRYDHQPYGGFHDSGLGREGVRYAMDEMTEAKFLALSSKLPL